MLTRLDAELYALTHRGTRGDVSHYRRVCRGADSVLELGAGSARLLCALARPRAEVWGLELEPAMLALGRRALGQLPPAARAGVKLLAGDMERVRLPRRFARVLLAYNALFCLLSRDAARRCLRAARALLQPDGILALDFWNAEALHAAGALQPTEDERLRLEHAGRAWRVLESCQAARGRQRLDVTYRYVPEDGGKPRSQLLRQRYYRVAEVVALLADAGLRVQTLSGGFSGTALTPGSSHVVVTATPA